ncbi:unnamed protein product, partial [Pelagomonas calceolata]
TVFVLYTSCGGQVRGRARGVDSIRRGGVLDLRHTRALRAAPAAARVIAVVAELNAREGAILLAVEIPRELAPARLGHSGHVPRVIGAEVVEVGVFFFVAGSPGSGFGQRGRGHGAAAAAAAARLATGLGLLAAAAALARRAVVVGGGRGRVVGGGRRGRRAAAALQTTDHALQIIDLVPQLFDFRAQAGEFLVRRHYGRRGCVGQQFARGTKDLGWES